MNQLSIEERVKIVAALVEGNSLRSVSRMTGIHRTTIMNLLACLGNACLAYQDKTLRTLSPERVQCDEIWSFVGCKEAQAKPEDKKKGRGDCWTWTAIDPDSKLAICWHVGLRDTSDGMLFLENLASRLTKRIQLSTDGHTGYLPAVENAFGANVDYGQAIKVYGLPKDDNRIEARYSPSRCKEIRRNVITGTPEIGSISTSHVERQNLTMRMSMRRFTRLTNAFSKKLENHAFAVSLHFMYYNFCRIHQSLRCTPAMQAGVSGHVWPLEEVIGLLEKSELKSA